MRRRRYLEMLGLGPCAREIVRDEAVSRGHEKTGTGNAGREAFQVGHQVVIAHTDSAEEATSTQRLLPGAFLLRPALSAVLIWIGDRTGGKIRAHRTTAARTRITVSARRTQAP